MGVLQRWVVAGVGQWREQKRDLNIALQKLLPFSIPCELCLIHRWVFLPLPHSSLNCRSPNPLFFLLIPPVFSLSPSSASPVPICLFSLIFLSSSWNLFPPSVLSLFRHSSPLSYSPWLCVHLQWDNRTWFLRRQRVVTDTVTKLPIKSMFNSDDFGPLTEKVEAFHLLKDWKKERDWARWRERVTGLMGLSSVVSLARRRNHEPSVPTCS